MKGRNVGPTFYWVLVVPLLIAYLPPSVNAATALKIRRNFTVIDRGLKPEASIGVPRRLPSPWVGKLTALRARLRTTPSEEEETTETVAAPAKDDRSEDSEVSSDNPLSVVWPVRARPGKRFRIPTPTTPAPQVLLKLLQPKPTRPAVYSLDGFVPKPSIQRIVSTEAPLNFKKTDLQLLATLPRKRKMNRYSKEEDDEYQYRRKVSRYTAFARKGIPGEDYPVYTFIPQTEFNCGPQPGLYADPFTDCQVWHMCPGGNLSPRHSFLCPNGTIFNQKKRICDWWYNVDCRARRIRSGADLQDTQTQQGATRVKRRLDTGQ